MVICMWLGEGLVFLMCIPLLKKKNPVWVAIPPLLLV